MSTLDEMKEIMRKIQPDMSLDDVSMDTRLGADLGLNSLTTMLLAMGIEDHFGIRFQEVLDFHTVGDVCAYIDEKRA